MKYNILIGGAAGQGIDTLSNLLERILKRKGFFVFSHRDYMSRVRGGHNFTQIRFGDQPVYSHHPELDLIFPLDVYSLEKHRERLNTNGWIICDKSVASSQEKVYSYDFSEIAKSIGDVRLAGTVGLGVILKMFGITLADDIYELIISTFGEEKGKSNKEALESGYKLTNQELSPRGQDKDEYIILNGNQAVALGALAGGAAFYSFYPMSPATGIMKYLSVNQREAKILVEQAEDEISAINMAIGASYCGVRTMVATSGGGFSLMVEALGLSGIAEIPLLVVNVQRPGPATGLATRTEQSDLSFVLTASHGEFPRMIIAVKDVTDCFYQTFRALNIAAKYRMPVILLSDQYLGDCVQTVKEFNVEGLDIQEYKDNPISDAEKYKTYKLTGDGISPTLRPGSIKDQIVLADSHEHNEYGNVTEDEKARVAMMKKRMKKLELLKEEIQEPDYLGVDNPEVLLIGWGSTYGPIKDAVETLVNEGMSVGALIFGDIYPLPISKLFKYAKDARKIINIEQNFTGQLAKLIMQETGIRCSDSVLKYDGRQIDCEEICYWVRKGVK